MASEISVYLFEENLKELYVLLVEGFSDDDKDFSRELVKTATMEQNA